MLLRLFVLLRERLISGKAELYLMKFKNQHIRNLQLGKQLIATELSWDMRPNKQWKRPTEHVKLDKKHLLIQAVSRVAVEAVPLKLLLSPLSAELAVDVGQIKHNVNAEHGRTPEQIRRILLIGRTLTLAEWSESSEPIMNRLFGSLYVNCMSDGGTQPRTQ